VRKHSQKQSDYLMETMYQLGSNRVLINDRERFTFARMHNLVQEFERRVLYNATEYPPEQMLGAEEDQDGSKTATNYAGRGSTVSGSTSSTAAPPGGQQPSSMASIDADVRYQHLQAIDARQTRGLGAKEAALIGGEMGSFLKDLETKSMEDYDLVNDTEELVMLPDPNPRDENRMQKKWEKELLGGKVFRTKHPKKSSFKELCADFLPIEQKKERETETQTTSTELEGMNKKGAGAGHQDEDNLFVYREEGAEVDRNAST
ncbi:unnamed protein product, partial [Amoebophrya sp. A120]